ncbi:hypothetical protein [Natronoglycomyces albus]|uniref:Transposase (putative) YhgA-like domain-containing protein n=1 Tax=Natronoglycomyces albus TaxID=2811108 RepID=A0A895XN80_9ACTN|nr:hypothetical protein [Natronoglycomyces albus]QSB04993.1 hypothetical protein JQS30_14695 [Natronoglycomyces albus]
MVTYEHEMPLTLLRHHPESGPALVTRLLGLELPAYTSVQPASEALTTTYPPELNCDGAGVLYDDEGRAVAALIVEMQMSHDPDKQYTWFAYLANLWRRVKCPTHLIVICPGRGTAKRAREAVTIGHHGMCFAPTVLGPDNIPEVIEPVTGPDSLLLTFLSALVHPDSAAREEIGKNLNDEFGELSVDQAVEYAKCALATFKEPMRMVMEGLMKTEKYDYHRALLGDSADTYLARGKAEGIAEGKVEGKVEGKAELIFVLIASRGITVTEEQRQRVSQCRDSELLDSWAVKAMNATEAADIFG